MRTTTLTNIYFKVMKKITLFALLTFLALFLSVYVFETMENLLDFVKDSFSEKQITADMIRQMHNQR